MPKADGGAPTPGPRAGPSPPGSGGRGGVVLALDLGTSTFKAALVGVDGLPLASLSQRMVYVTPRGGPAMARQLSPRWVWGAMGGLARGVMDAGGVAARQVVAVGVTSQRQGVALLDQGGREVYLGPNLDLRAVFEGASMDSAHAALVYETTGRLPSFFFAPAKIRWLELHRPGAYRRARAVLPLGDWLGFRLTGVVGGSPALAGEAGLLEVATGGWAVSLMVEMGLRADLFPPISAQGVALGGVSREAAAATGLREGVPVVVAGPDTQCGLVGMGVASAGEAGVVAGWSTAVQVVTPSPAADPLRRTWVGLHALPGLWVSEASAGDGGNTLQWLKGLLFGGRRDGFARLEGLASRVPVGSDGALAMLGPAVMDLSRPGIKAGGLLFPVPVAFSGLGPGHVARAALENVAFAVRGALERLQEVNGRPPSDVSLGGGMARMALFNRILASVLGRPVRVAGYPGVSALGAAMVAAASLGGGPRTLALACGAARDRITAVEPDPLEAMDYEEHYRRWLDAQERLQGML